MTAPAPHVYCHWIDATSTLAPRDLARLGILGDLWRVGKKAGKWIYKKVWRRFQPTREFVAAYRPVRARLT